jgi:hypothetical protein
MAALTGHIARQAPRIAAKTDSGRLDPPLTLVLDEAALIAPVPLDSWTADMGLRGVSILAAFQSRAQLIARWGQAGAAIILNNAAAVMLFGGTQDREDLAHWVTLVGEREEPHTTHDAGGRVTSRTTRRVPVLSSTQLANLPKRRVVVFRHGMPPVLGWAGMAWKRYDVRIQARLARRAARAVVNEAVGVARSAHPAGAPSPTSSPTSPTSPVSPAQRVAGWVTRRPLRGRVGEPSPTSPGSPAPASPAPAHPWVVDTRGVTRATNGTHPLGTPPA